MVAPFCFILSPQENLVSEKDGPKFAEHGSFSHANRMQCKEEDFETPNFGATFERTKTKWP
jgi:hypothetical protein